MVLKTFFLVLENNFFILKKLLFILFIIPVLIYGQDVPLIEKKVTTESMENNDRKLKEKAANKEKQLSY